MVNDLNPSPNHFIQSLERDDDSPHKSDYYDLNSKIMLTAIISLSFVVVLVTILHLYARCLLRRQARRRAALQHLGLAVHTPEPPKTGLDPAVIAGLPIFPFTQKDAKDEAGQTECAVCLSILESGEIARLLPNCNHTFHAECINTWLTSQSTCPICRAEAEPREHPVAIATHAAPPSAPPTERGNFTSTGTEGTSEGKTVSGSSSRLSSFRRILSRERSSSRIIPPCGEEAGTEDLERQ